MMWYYERVRDLLYDLRQIIPAEHIAPPVPGATNLIRLAQSYIDWAAYYLHECRLSPQVALSHLWTARKLLAAVRRGVEEPCYEAERLEHVFHFIDDIIAEIRRLSSPPSEGEEFSEEYVELLDLDEELVD